MRRRPCPSRETSRETCASAALTLLACIAVIALPGCPGRSLAELPIGQDVVQHTNLELDDNRDVDILFVIDSSGSMKKEQDSLAAKFPAIISALGARDGLPSVHLGVITTDVGGGELCPGVGDDGALQVGLDTCNAINDGKKFISDIANEDGTRSANYDGTLADAFSCMAKVGISGCGFEAPLESLKRAIERPENAMFFRDHAYLAVIIISDEDDCSLLAPGLLDDTGDVSPAVLESPLGAVSSLRCFEFGVTCDGPADAREPGVRTSCRPQSGSPYVSDVAPYIEHLRGSKKFPSQILVAGIAGNLEPVAVEMRASMQYSFDIPQLAFSCNTMLGEAVPPIRIEAFLNAFENSTLATVCDDDLTRAVEQVADFISKPGGPPCLEGSLVDTSEAPGVQPDCSIIEVINPGIDGEIERVLGACDNPGDPPSSSELPCFHMYEDPINCSAHPSQLAVDVIYPDGFTVPPLTRAEVSCVSE